MSETGDIAEYYDNEGLGTDEELEEDMVDKDMSSADLRIFLVTYNNGNFHSSTTDQDIAWETARRIGGIIGELTNVYRPKYLEEVAPPELAAKVIEFLDSPESGVRRDRPKAA